MTDPATAQLWVLLVMLAITLVAAVIVEVIRQQAKPQGTPLARHARDPKAPNYTRDHPPSLDEWAAERGPDEWGMP